MGGKRIALITHDNRKRDLLEWTRFNQALPAQHRLCAAGTMDRLLGEELGLTVERVRTGPLGRDQQIEARIVEEEIDLLDPLVVFWDRLEPHPHDIEAKVLVRIAVVYDIPVACNRASAGFLILSPLVAENSRSTGDPPAPNVGKAAKDPPPPPPTVLTPACFCRPLMLACQR